MQLQMSAIVLQISVSHMHTTVLWPFFRDHPGELVPEENFWTLWCKGRLTGADTPTIRLGATPSGLTSAHLHHPIFTGRMPPNQQCQSTEGNQRIGIREKMLVFSSIVLPAPSPYLTCRYLLKMQISVKELQISANVDKVLKQLACWLLLALRASGNLPVSYVLTGNLPPINYQ